MGELTTGLVPRLIVLGGTSRMRTARISRVTRLVFSGGPAPRAGGGVRSWLGVEVLCADPQTAQEDHEPRGREVLSLEHTYICTSMDTYIRTDRQTDRQDHQHRYNNVTVYRYVHTLALTQVPQMQILTELTLLPSSQPGIYW